MPRKKKSETESYTPKASSKTKSTAKGKASPKASRTTAKRTSKALSPQAAAVPKGGKVSKDVSTPAVEPRPGKKLQRHGETQAVAFFRDSHCIFTYWEVTPERIESVKKQLMEESRDSIMVLKVFRGRNDGHAELIQEIRVEPGEMNRYVELKEDVPGGYFIEVAQKTPSGRTLVYARSNKVMAGAIAVSQVDQGRVTSTWETPPGLLEYFKELEGAGDPQALRGLSSAEVHRRALMRKRMGLYSASRME